MTSHAGIFMYPQKLAMHAYYVTFFKSLRIGGRKSLESTPETVLRVKGEAAGDRDKSGSQHMNIM